MGLSDALIVNVCRDYPEYLTNVKIDKSKFNNSNSEKSESFKKNFLQRGNIVSIYSNFINNVNEVFAEVTSLLTVVFLTYGLIKAISN